MTATIQKILKPIKYRAVDTSGNNNHGKIYSGRALEFDGIADYLRPTTTNGDTAGGVGMLTTSGNSSAQDNRTVAFWMKTAETGTFAAHQQIFYCSAGGGNEGYGIVLKYNTGLITMEVDDGTTRHQQNGSFDFRIAGQTWHRVICVFDGVNCNMTMYVNGIETLNTNTSQWTGDISPSHVITIGGHSTAATYPFDGMMADFQVWNELWTQSDATYDYLNPESLALNNSGTSLAESNLKLWYPMQDGHRGQQSYIIDGANTILGSELITNGDFSDTTSISTAGGIDLAGWTSAGITHNKTNNVSISNGQATLISDGSDVRIQQTILTIGVTYKYSIDIISASSGAIKLQTSASFDSGSISTVGTHTGYFTADATVFRIRRSGSCNVTFDNVSIKAVNDKHHATTVFFGDEKITEENNRLFEASTGVDWTSFDSGGTSNTTVSIDSNVANKLQVTTSTEDAIEGCRLVQGNFQSGGGQIVVGRTYRVSVDLQLTTPGSGTGDWTAFTIKLGGTASSEFDITYSEATYTKDITVTDNTGSLQIYNSSSTQTIFTVDNVSIKEVGTATGWTDADQQLDIPQTALQSYNQLAWFPGVDPGTDYDIDCTSDSDIDDIFDGGGTFSAWIYPTGLGASTGRIADKTKWFLYISDDNGTAGDLTFKMLSDGDSTLTRSTNRVITYGKWYHIVVTFNASSFGTNAILYVNGEKIAITETTGSGTRSSDASYNLFLGNQEDGARTWEGTMTEVSMWNDVFTQAEVNELYNDGKVLDAREHSAWSLTNLKGYWKNNGLVTWTDLSNYGNNGTVNNLTETLLLPAGVDASRDTQGFLMNRQKNTNSLNLKTSESLGVSSDGPDVVIIEDSTSFDHSDGTDSKFSVSLWFKANDYGSLPQDQVIMSKGTNDGGKREWKIMLDDNSTTQLRLEGSSPTNGGSGNDLGYTLANITDTDWHHIVVTYDGTEISGNEVVAYLDGGSAILRSDGDAEIKINAEDGNVVIGDCLLTNTGGDGFEFDGQIDDVCYYNRKILSATEAKRNYNAGKRSHR